MPKTCLLCKAKPCSMCKRTFHMFPEEGSIKQKWLDAINLSKIQNFRTAYICSNHFNEKSLLYSDELSQRKHLRKETVPKTRGTKETAIISINNCEVSNVTKDINFKVNTNETEVCTDEVPSDISSQSHLNENDVSKDISIQSGTEKVIETRVREVPLNNCGKLNGSTPRSQSKSKKRKFSVDNVRIQKKERFMNGFKTEYIFREDFVSEEAWNRFLRYSAYQSSTTLAIHNTNSHNEKKVKSLIAFINTYLEKREEYTRV